MRVKLIGNLRYYLRQLLLSSRNNKSYTFVLFMLQKEMGAGISARPAPASRIITLAVQRRYRVNISHVPRASSAAARCGFGLCSPDGAFSDELPAHDGETFARLVRAGFSQRRKQLRNLISTEIPAWEQRQKRSAFTACASGGIESVPVDCTIQSSQSGSCWGRQSGTLGEVHGGGRSRSPSWRSTRAEVHGNNLRHRAAHIFVLRPK